MRRLIDAGRIQQFMRDLGRTVRVPARVYLAGGSSAVLLDWRATTIDVDLKIEPDSDAILRVLPALKESAEINIELASPGDFIPELPGWRERSVFIAREGSLDFFHYDFYAQALAKIERGHARDLLDVEAMRQKGLIVPGQLTVWFQRIEPELYRYPAIAPSAFREAVDRAVASLIEGRPLSEPAR
jgi:hypothetical protein